MTRRRLIAAAEALVAAGVVIGHNVLLVVPNEVMIITVLGIISFALRRQPLSAIGFARPIRWTGTLLVATCIAVVLQLVSTYVTEPLVVRYTHRPSDLSEFRPLVGNVRLLLLYFVLIWTFAAFGEEFAYRGYLLRRTGEAAGASRGAWIVSIIVCGLLFGIGHYYQGPTGVIDSSISGLVLGTLYVWWGCNLWLPILTHGLSDTIGLIIIFAGWVTV